MSAPNRGRALRQYRRLAPRYDRSISLRAINRHAGTRRRAVDALELIAGDRMIDLGCGTGASFPALAERVGPHGTVIGIDQSPDMLHVAHRRIAELGLRNVTTIEAAVQQLPPLPDDVNALLLLFTHDIVRDRDALLALVAQLPPGTRVVAAGVKHTTRWLAPLNAIGWLFARRYVTTTEGLARPWDHLADALGDVRVRRRALGLLYILRGTVPVADDQPG